MAESKEELQSLFLKVKEEGENVALKLDIQKTKIRHLFSSLHGKYVGNNENRPFPVLWPLLSFPNVLEY